MDPGLKLLAFLAAGSLIAFSARWAFKKLCGEPTPDPTQSPGAEPYSAGMDDGSHFGV